VERLPNNSGKNTHGATGGGWADNPRWVKILLMVVGSVIAAMIRSLPWQCGQIMMSMLNTRFNSLAQLMRQTLPVPCPACF